MARQHFCGTYCSRLGQTAGALGAPRRARWAKLAERRAGRRRPAAGRVHGLVQPDEDGLVVLADQSTEFLACLRRRPTQPWRPRHGGDVPVALSLSPPAAGRLGTSYEVA